MSDLEECLDALRALARSDDRTKLIEAEMLIHEFSPSPSQLRASLEGLDNAAIREAELSPQDASFWQGVREIVAARLEGLLR